MTRVPPGVENWISRTGSEATSIGASRGNETLGARAAGRRCAGLGLFTGTWGGAVISELAGGTEGVAAGTGTAAT
jgi:hypothetical protein